MVPLKILLQYRSKVLGWYDFFCNVFERILLYSQRLHLFDQQYSKNSNILKYCYNLKNYFSILIYFETFFFWLQSDHSCMLIWCSSNISYDYQFRKTGMLLNIFFVETIHFSGFFDE